jgi:hypothetical protein
MNLTPDHIKKTTLYLDRELEAEFRSLLTEQGIGLGVGVNRAIQDYLKKHNKPVPNDGSLRMRSRRLIYCGEKISA